MTDMSTLPSSIPSRQFIASNYTAVKAANPNLPILIREAKGAEAKIFARFGKTLTRIGYSFVDYSCRRDVLDFFLDITKSKEDYNQEQRS